MSDFESDLRLLQKIREGDERAFDKLFEQYWDLLFNAAYGRLKSADLAKDVVQDVFIDFWKRRGSIQLTNKIEVYLFTAVKYQIFKLIDQMSIEVGLENEDSVHLMPQEEILSLEELYHKLEVALDELPEMAGIIFKMNKLQGLSASEVALKLEINVQSVHNSIHKSIKILKNSLKSNIRVFLLF